MTQATVDLEAQALAQCYALLIRKGRARRARLAREAAAQAAAAQAAEVGEIADETETKNAPE